MIWYVLIYIILGILYFDFVLKIEEPAHEWNNLNTFEKIVGFVSVVSFWWVFIIINLVSFIRE